MKKLGIIGGMSWESTATYYEYLNEGVRARLGGLHSAELLLYSFDFARIEALQSAGDWEGATKEMVRAAQALKHGGADALIIATNTMHKMADEVEEASGLPLYHIADATADAIHQSQVKTPLLLATNFTMTQDFYKERLRLKHGIDVVVPDVEERLFVHEVIYHELCRGIISQSSKSGYVELVDTMKQTAHIDGVIFGCTEIGLLVSPDDFDVPAFDTTKIHCDYALNMLLRQG